MTKYLTLLFVGLALGQGFDSNDTLKVSIYQEDISGVNQYIRVSDYSIHNKKEFMYYDGIFIMEYTENIIRVQKILVNLEETE